MALAEIRKLKGLDYINAAYNQTAAVKEIKVAAPKVPKDIPKKSDKQKFITAELKKLYVIFLKKHTKCEIHGPNCTGAAKCAHHSEGRLPSKILDTTKWVPSCAACNLWCETNHAEAAKKGFKKSKF